MTKRFENQEFEGLGDIDTGRIFQDMEFRKCDFLSSSISMGSDSRLRAIVRHVRLQECRVRASFVGNAILDEVVIDGLDTGLNFYLETRGAAFRHVVLSGEIGRIMINGRVSFMRPQIVQDQFDAANKGFYEEVDWALDISSAEFYECSAIACIPVDLIRRDPETQVVVRRPRALNMTWKNLDVGAYAKYVLERFVARLDPGDTDGMVLVAPKRHPKFLDVLRGLQVLRQAGIADPA